MIFSTCHLVNQSYRCCLIIFQQQSFYRNSSILGHSQHSMSLSSSSSTYSKIKTSKMNKNEHFDNFIHFKFFIH